MPTIGPEGRCRAATRVAVARFDDGAVLYDPETGVAHAVNPTGALVWELLDGDATLAELADDIAEAYGSDRDEVVGQLVALADQLHELGLLEGAEPDPRPGAFPWPTAGAGEDGCLPDPPTF